MKHQIRTAGAGARSWSASFGLVALGLLAALHIGGATFVDIRLSTTLDAGDDITDAGGSYGSLVRMSYDGTILVVLSRLEDSRAVLTYTLEGDRTWTLTQTLSLAPATGVEDMALSGDGEILVLALRPSTVETYVEVWASPPEGRGTWTRATSGPILTLTGDESEEPAVATSFDGSVIAVGAPRYDEPVFDGVYEIFEDAGRIYTLRDDGSRTWAAQVFTASAFFGQERERVGTAIAVSADGRTIVATSPGLGSVVLPPPYGGISELPFGGAYVFSLRSGGFYRQQDELRASGNRGDSAGNCGGLNTCVAIDGDTIAIGAPFLNYVDIFVGSFGFSGGYSRQATITPSGSQSFLERFGSAVALRDGFSLVGAPGISFRNRLPGAAYLFRRLGATWDTEPAVIDPPSELEAQIQYGRSMALTGPFVAISSLTPGASFGDSVGKVTVFGTTGSFPPIPSPTFPPSEVPSAMPTESMPAAVPTFAPIGIGDKCATGISNENVCCALECGICGGCDCALLGDAIFGGAAFCCPATIRFNDIPCTTSTDVGCVIRSIPPPPPRARTGTECRD